MNMELLTSRLYNPVLITPATEGADTLRIVSGFASPAMALRHLHDLQNIKHSINIQLVFGMAKHNGIEVATHKSFMDIQGRFFNFSCHYSYEEIPIHAKVYTWCKGDDPILCYTGSANYTQNGFKRSLQREVMTKTSAVDGLQFFYDSYGKAINCTDDPFVKEHIPLFKSDKTHQKERSGLPEVELSLLNSRTKQTHNEGGGLNWGHRGDRNRNEAYIPVPSRIAQTTFFPEKDQYFTVLTADDDFSFIARIAQANRKAIHSSDNNSIIGKYFRDRLGLDSGQYITRQHLEDYGRTSVKFMRIDDETYVMDFSPHRDGAEQEAD